MPRSDDAAHLSTLPAALPCARGPDAQMVAGIDKAAGSPLCAWAGCGGGQLHRADVRLSPVRVGRILVDQAICAAVGDGAITRAGWPPDISGWSSRFNISTGCHRLLKGGRWSCVDSTGV